MTRLESRNRWDLTGLLSSSRVITSVPSSPACLMCRPTCCCCCCC